MNVTMIIVFPGSFLYKHACNVGIIKDKEKFLRDGCPLVNVSKLTDQEYWDLTSVISELRLHPHVPAQSPRIQKIHPSGECEVEFECRKCGVRSLSTVWFWYGKEIYCPSCNLINYVDPFESATHLQETFSSLLPLEDTIALWGAGGIYYKLANKYDLLSSDKFLLVDADVSRQGLRICKKRVFSPNVILEKGIKSVVITALSRKEDIYANLRRCYPSVENILMPGFDIARDKIIPILQPYLK
jgi:anaerobic magnesium-protoporphyrin IX monomethyl ester cyclase